MTYEAMLHKSILQTFFFLGFGISVDVNFRFEDFETSDFFYIFLSIDLL